VRFVADGVPRMEPNAAALESEYAQPAWRRPPDVILTVELNQSDWSWQHENRKQPENARVDNSTPLR
jgi:hypothetical protein